MTDTAAPVTPTPRVVDAGDGPPVLCLHGWGASSDLFAPVIGSLRARFRLVVPDLPGHGDTPAPPQAWAIADYVDWTIALLDSLGLHRVDIIGHSFGARIAIKLAALHPGRVQRLVLTGAAGVRARHGIGYHVRVRSFKALRRIAVMPATPAGVRRWAQGRVERAGSRDYRAAQGAMRGTFVRVVNEDLRGFMPRIAAPTLLVWGDEDDETPVSAARTMERLIPDAGLVVFAGRGHYAYIDEASRFAHIVATFLDPAAAGPAP